MFQTEDKNCCLCRVAIIGEAIGRFIRAFEMEFNVWKTSALKLTLTDLDLDPTAVQPAPKH